MRARDQFGFPILTKEEWKENITHQDIELYEAFIWSIKAASVAAAIITIAVLWFIL